MLCTLTAISKIVKKSEKDLIEICLQLKLREDVETILKYGLNTQDLKLILLEIGYTLIDIYCEIQHEGTPYTISYSDEILKRLIKKYPNNIIICYESNRGIPHVELLGDCDPNTRFSVFWIVLPLK